MLVVLCSALAAAIILLAAVAFDGISFAEGKQLLELLLKFIGGMGGLGVAGYSYRDHEKEPT